MAQTNPKQTLSLEDLISGKSSAASVAKVKTKGKNRKVQEALLQKGRACHMKEDWRGALKYYDEAWGNDPDNLDLLTLVAFALTQLDAREQAMDVVERALKLHGATEVLCQILGVLATKMFFHEIAEKLWRQAINLNPKTQSNYVNLLGAMYEQEKFDEVVTYAQDILPVFPDNSDLWSILATSIRFTDNRHLAYQFFEEALKHNPNNIRALNNYSMILGMSDRGFELCKHSVTVEPDNPEINVGLSMHYFARGMLEPGFRHYEYRLAEGRAKHQDVRYRTSFAPWDGTSDKNASILVMSEQGIGDEVFFMRMIERLKDDMGQVLLGCDRRLASIVGRSMPDVIAVPHVNIEKLGFIERHYPDAETYLRNEKPEKAYCVHAGSLMYHYVSDPGDIPNTRGYLKADPARREFFARKLEIYRDKPLVGFSWQTGRVTAQRSVNLLNIDTYLDFFAGKDLRVVVLQYSEPEKDIEYIRDRLGADNVIFFEDVDLKDDIEANLAIMDNLDCIVGPGIATQMFAIGLGCETWQVCHGRPWWNFDSTQALSKTPYIPNLHWIDSVKGKTGWSWENSFDGLELALEQVRKTKKLTR